MAVLAIILKTAPYSKTRFPNAFISIGAALQAGTNCGSSLQELAEILSAERVSNLSLRLQECREGGRLLRSLGLTTDGREDFRCADPVLWYPPRLLKGPVIAPVARKYAWICLFSHREAP